MLIILNYLLSALIIILAFPIGYLLAKICKEELVAGRILLFALYLTSLILTLIFIFLPIDKQFKLPIILSLIFIVIVSFMAFWLSYNKKFVYSLSK